MEPPQDLLWVINTILVCINESTMSQLMCTLTLSFRHCILIRNSSRSISYNLLFEIPRTARCLCVLLLVRYTSYLLYLLQDDLARHRIPYVSCTIFQMPSDSWCGSLVQGILFQVLSKPFQHLQYASKTWNRQHPYPFSSGTNDCTSVSTHLRMWFLPYVCSLWSTEASRMLWAWLIFPSCLWTFPNSNCVSSLLPIRDFCLCSSILPNSSSL